MPSIADRVEAACITPSRFPTGCWPSPARIDGKTIHWRCVLKTRTMNSTPFGGRAFLARPRRLTYARRMTLYYAAFSGFYDSDIHTVIPQAAVEITPEPHRALLSANAQGAAILPDETGHPTAVFPSEAEQHAQKAESIRAERNGTVGLLNHESGCRLAAAAVSTPAARGSPKNPRARLSRRHRSTCH